MESYHYVDIFETKGLEYILLIIFMLLLIYLIRYLEPVKDEGPKGD